MSAVKPSCNFTLPVQASRRARTRNQADSQEKETGAGPSDALRRPVRALPFPDAGMQYNITAELTHSFALSPNKVTPIR